MKTLGYGLATLILWLLRLAGRTVAATSRLAWLLALPPAAWYVHRRSQGAFTRPAAAPDDRQWPVNVPLPPPTAVVPACAPAPDVADRIIALRLDPPVGLIHLRLYRSRKLVRRELVVLEPCLRDLLRGRCHALPPVPYDPLAGLEAAKQQAVEDAATFINTRGRKAHKGRLRQPTRQQPQESEPAPEGRALPSAAVPPAPPASAVDAVAVPGQTYVGCLLRAGTETVTPPGRPAYDIFAATLRLDNGAELALRGTELQRELAAGRCRIGQRLAVTALGRLPLALADGSQGHRNLYRVRPAPPPLEGQA